VFECGVFGVLICGRLFRREDICKVEEDLAYRPGPAAWDQRPLPWRDLGAMLRELVQVETEQAEDVKNLLVLWVMW
jgi:hypothetical protein